MFLGRITLLKKGCGREGKGHGRRRGGRNRGARLRQGRWHRAWWPTPAKATWEGLRAGKSGSGLTQSAVEGGRGEKGTA